MVDRRIIIYNGGWFLNIGNAFIDFGARRCLQDVYGSEPVSFHLTSAGGNGIIKFMNSGVLRWIGQLGRRKAPKRLSLLAGAKASHIVLAGAVLSDQWFQLCGGPLQKCAEETGARIVLIGVSASEGAYSRKSVEATKRHLKRLRPSVFASRDEATFEAFRDVAHHVYNGIDAAFFVADDYRPPSVGLPPYVVLNFDRLPEPKSLPADLRHLFQVRTHHTFWMNFPPHKWLSMRTQYFGRDYTLFSDLPYEYLALYANSQATLSDRIHACVATLAYGGSAMLYSKSPRSGLFERVGAGSIGESLTKLDKDLIADEKKQLTNFLQSVLLEG